jgi:hypothetical protein
MSLRFVSNHRCFPQASVRKRWLLSWRLVGNTAWMQDGFGQAKVDLPLTESSVTPWMTGQRGSRHQAGGDEGGVIGVVRDRGQSSPGWTIAYDG